MSIQVKQADVSGVKSMKITIDGVIPEENLPASLKGGPNKIKYNEGLSLYKDNAEVEGQTEKVTFKTVQKQNVIGTGNIDIKAAEEFPQAWKDASDDINQLLSKIYTNFDAVAGKVYLGKVSETCLPADFTGTVANCYVKILSYETVGGLEVKKYVLVIQDQNNSPYHWENYVTDTTANGWKSWSDATRVSAQGTTSGFIKFWKGTQAQYDTIGYGNHDEDTLYIIRG